MLIFSWIDRITHKEVSKRAGESMLCIQNRRIKPIGHIVRNESLLKTIAEGLIEGKK